MNQIRTGCGSCPYNLNGEQCTNPEDCYGCYQKPTEDFNNTAFGGSSNHWMSKPIFCSICGKPLSGVYAGAPEDNPQDAFHICNECKAAIEWAKRQVATARKVEYDPSRLKGITKEQEPIDKITDEKEKAIELIQNTFNLSEFSIFGFEHDLFNGKLTLYDFAKGIINLITDNKIKKSSPSFDIKNFNITVRDFVQRFVPHKCYVVIRNQEIIPIVDSVGGKEIKETVVWEGYDHLITDYTTCCKYSDCNVNGIYDASEDFDGLNPIGILISIEKQKHKSTTNEDLGILGE